MRRALARTPDSARLTARPHLVSRDSPRPGVHALGVDAERDTYVFVPRNLGEQRFAPLVLLLHGAGGEGRGTLELLERDAEERGTILVAPSSKRATWDFIVRDFGPDVRAIDRALELVFSRYAIDPEHVAIAGFSDGASYALTLGVANGDLFTHVIAFSPGFMAAPSLHGHPHVYVSHGDADQVLDVDRCSRRLVPQLQHLGYDVRYHEFAGPHEVPQPVREEAMRWFLDQRGPQSPQSEPSGHKL